MFLVSRGLAVLLALALVLGARSLGVHANQTRKTWAKSVDLPYAPSAGSAPYVTLGIRALIEAIVALDPRFERAYAFGGIAMTAIGNEATNEDRLAAIRVLERGM